MMRLWLTIIVLVLLLLVAVRNGGAPERYTAFAIAIAFTFNALVIAIQGPSDFQTFEPLRCAIEVGMFVACTLIAVYANRFWPICIAALQLIILTAHLARLIDIQGLAGVYWGITTIPSYLQLMVLVIGIRSHAQRKTRLGPYRDWRVA